MLAARLRRHTYGDGHPDRQQDTQLRIDRHLSGGGEFLQDSLIHPNAGVEILKRKILVWRMRAAIRQGQAA